MFSFFMSPGSSCIPPFLISMRVMAGGAASALFSGDIDIVAPLEVPSNKTVATTATAQIRKIDANVRRYFFFTFFPPDNSG